VYVTVPYTAYDLQLAGYTSKGLGPPSEAYPVLTDVTGLLLHLIYLITLSSICMTREFNRTTGSRRR